MRGRGAAPRHGERQRGASRVAPVAAARVTIILASLFPFGSVISSLAGRQAGCHLDKCG